MEDGCSSRAMLGQAGEEHEQSTRSVAMAGAAGALARDYRRGNWTVPETMLLIEAKRKVHGERHPGDHGLARWRWVEDYCWRAGCRRSHNQCNDRWDNLMRDYKKVRAYEMAGSAPSYWAMGKAERKDRGLPSNLLREIYDAMGEVIEMRMNMGGGSGGTGAGGAFLGASPGLLHHVPMQASPLAQFLPRPLPLEQETTRHHVGHGAAHFGSESPERKRRRPSLDEPRPGTGSNTPSSAQATGTHAHQHRQEQQGHGHRDHGCGGGGDEDESSDSECSGDGGGEEGEEEDVLSGAIGRCAAILSEALESREAAEERRHREVMAVEERRGRARQARREAGEQCVAGLAAAVNQLAGSMLALAAAKHKDNGGGARGPAAPNK
ncbi:unnamed protein product [Urochloa humidicola]